MSQICKSPSCFFESKQKTNFEEKKEKNKIYNVSKTELEANLLQNTRILERWKLENY